MERTTFGRLLREGRVRAGKSMGELARHLGVSVTFVSDVENDKRAPLTADRIVKAAELFGIDAEPLMQAAATGRRSFNFEGSKTSEKGREALGALQRGFADIDDETWAEITNVLNKKGQ